MRRVLYALGGLATLVVALVVAVYAVSATRLRRTFDVPLTDVALASDSATLARGQHLVRVVGKCAECHGQDLGGAVFIPDGPARLIAPEPHDGGHRGPLHDRRAGARDPARRPARRHGAHDHAVGRLQSALRPGRRRDHLLHQVAPRRRAHAAADGGRTSSAARCGRPASCSLLDAARIDHAKPHLTQVAMTTGPGYGHYLADVGGCTGCHGPGLSGGKIPGTPPEWKPAANITPTGIGAWSLDDFKRALREGKRPNGTPIDTIMPWQASGHMTDDEIASVYAFLRAPCRRRSSGTVRRGRVAHSFIPQITQIGTAMRDMA